MAVTSFPPVADGPDPDPPADEFLSGKPVPQHLVAPLAIARAVWHECWPGMSLDGSAEAIVQVLDLRGYIKRTRNPRAAGHVHAE